MTLSEASFASPEFRTGLVLSCGLIQEREGIERGLTGVNGRYLDLVLHRMESRGAVERCIRVGQIFLEAERSLRAQEAARSRLPPAHSMRTVTREELEVPGGIRTAAEALRDRILDQIAAIIHTPLEQRILDRYLERRDPDDLCAALVHMVVERPPIVLPGGS